MRSSVRCSHALVIKSDRCVKRHRRLFQIEAFSLVFQQSPASLQTMAADAVVAQRAIMPRATMAESPLML